MSESQRLKEILDGVAKRFGVTKGRVWATVRKSVKGFGNGWNTRRYVERPINAEEAKAFSLPPAAVVLSFAGRREPCLVLSPSTYKDKDQREHPTVCAYAYAYLKSVNLDQPHEEEFVDDHEMVDGHVVPIQRRVSVHDGHEADAQEP